MTLSPSVEKLPRAEIQGGLFRGTRLWRHVSPLAGLSRQVRKLAATTLLPAPEPCPTKRNEQGTAHSAVPATISCSPRPHGTQSAPFSCGMRTNSGKMRRKGEVFGRPCRRGGHGDRKTKEMRARPLGWGPYNNNIGCILAPTDWREKRLACPERNRMPRKTRDAVGAPREGPAAALFSSASRRLSPAVQTPGAFSAPFLNRKRQ
jgi:hypothetical protein